MTELLLGISLGWAAGVSPGPLLALVVTTALQRGTAAGVRVALAPLITDAPVVVAAIVVLSSVPDRVVRWLGVAGGLYLIWLGIGEIRAARGGQGFTEDLSGATDLRSRGALTNILNPQMWTFWIVVGGPIVATADSALAAGLFLLGFYVLLLGTKVALAAVVGSSRRRLLGSGWLQTLGVVGGLGMVAIGMVLAIRS